MPTGDNFVNLVLKRFLSQSRMNSMLLNYLQDMFYDGISRIFPTQGMFTYPFVLTNNGDGTFTIGTDPLIGTDGEGHVLKLTGTSRTDNIPFEDTAATNYWIGMHYIEVPNGLQTNPRTGQVEYDYITEEIGELGNPTSAADGGGGASIKLVVDSIFENGVDYSGREVRVWLTDPMSADTSVAFETLSVSYDGGSGENSVTTVGLLGQSSISTVAADYQVAALGVSVKKSVGNPWTADPYCIIGYVEGSSSNKNVTDAVDFSGGGGHTLQKAYDGAAGAGDGRDVTVANEAIVLDQSNPTFRAQDIGNALLRGIKDGDRAIASGVPKDFEGANDMLHRLMARYSYMSRVNLVDQTGNDFLAGSEPIDVSPAGDTITFTGGFASLTLLAATGQTIMRYIDLVEIVQSSNGNDGLYVVNNVASATTMTLYELDGTTAASLNLETGTSMEARVYRPVVAVHGDTGLAGYGIQIANVQDWTGLIGLGRDYVPLRILIGTTLPPGTKIIDVIEDDATATPVWTLYSTGLINMRDALLMNGNDVDTEGGDLLLGGGDLDTEGGNIDTNNGDVNAGTGIIYTSGAGYVVAPQVSSYINVTADSNGDGSGDFTYGLAKTEYHFLSPHDAMGTIVNPTGEWEWIYSEPNHFGGVTPGLLRTTIQNAELVFPLHLPAGTIKRILAIVDQGVSASMQMYLGRQTLNWSTPDPISNPSTLGGAWNTIGAGIQLIDSGVITVGISSISAMYITLRNVAASGTHLFYGIRVEHQQTTVRPPV